MALGPAYTESVPLLLDPQVMCQADRAVCEHEIWTCAP